MALKSTVLQIEGQLQNFMQCRLMCTFPTRHVHCLPIAGSMSWMMCSKHKDRHKFEMLTLNSVHSVT